MIPSKPHMRYRLALTFAATAAFFLVWLGLGVGIIGADGDPANLMYGAVLAVAALGALIARFRPNGMAVAIAAAAIAQAIVTIIALSLGLGQPASPPAELIGLNGGFIAMWLASAWLFRKAAPSPATTTGPA